MAFEVHRVSLFFLVLLIDFPPNRYIKRNVKLNLKKYIIFHNLTHPSHKRIFGFVGNFIFHDILECCFCRVLFTPLVFFLLGNNPITVVLVYLFFFL